MRILIGFTLLVLVHCRVVDRSCDGIIVHNIKHEKEILKHDIDSAYQLAIDYDTNTLFFSFSTPHDSSDVFKSAYLNLKNNEYGIITGIPGGFANSVDNRKHKVYLGGNNGIYSFDFDTKRAFYISDSDKNIWQLFYKNKLYFTEYPNEKAYYYENGVSKKVPELEETRAMLLAVDNNENIFFSNSSGLYCYKSDKSKIISVGEYNVNGFTSDINGNLFFSTPEGLYSINGQEIKLLANIDNVYGLAIEGDNSIIYADMNSIVRLKPTKTVCYSEDKKTIVDQENQL